MKISLKQFIKELSAKDNISQKRAGNYNGELGAGDYFGIKNFNNSVMELLDEIVYQGKKKIIKLISEKGNLYFVNYTNKNFMDVAEGIMRHRGIKDWEFEHVGINEVNEEYRDYLSSIIEIHNEYKASLVHINRKFNF